MFDTDSNGLIDAVEIFTGIIVFSDAIAEEKIRFLFDLYDFNEMQSLSLMELEFLLGSVLEATKKIFELKIDYVDVDIV
jgi:Ca2+-binding EF-hand superfamily protein